MFDKLELIKQNYLKWQKKILENQENLQNIELLKQMSKIQKIVFLYDEYIELKKELSQLEIELIQRQNGYDNQMINLIKEEKKNLNQKIDQKTNILEKILFAEEDENNQNVIIEIKRGIGGREANLFVADLFRAYMKHAESKKWKTEVIYLMNSFKNGITSVEFTIHGKNTYSWLKYESGIHRVQRIPETEKKGRIHTSTAKVLVIPNKNELKIDINWNDIRTDTFNSSGPGGQSVNTTKSAVRLTHLPTGISVACQIAKSQHENKDKAFKLLTNKIYYQKISQQKREKNDIKKNFISKADRSEKIRTYDYSHNKIIDHRINLTINKLDMFMEGHIDLIIKPLTEELQKQKFQKYCETL
ncbi:PCRF domain-containing protein [Candidatus Phytoplasma melaleucae]|uniref:PCRF domain-containing protein n=1 Tax=Candidatus Phytoplasma melaleucae TaxID=2982630 RepID=A0ABT9DF99_9MOLU|nr:PCRF domain-containing protein ['Melaleuca sp.' phytoplasma]MDO8167994.1 PCRF domain-containing protein ['Melaleuca sp.' phytoplasma]